MSDLIAALRTPVAEPGTGHVEIGTPMPRIDGRAKVTGQASYAAEHAAEGMLYGVIVNSPVAKGRLRRIGVDDALAVPGVVDVMTHENRPRISRFDLFYKDMTAPPGSPFRPLYDDQIIYSGQPVALVLASTFEAARRAAALVTVEVAAEAHETDLLSQLHRQRDPKGMRIGFSPPPKPKGKADEMYQKAPFKVDGSYYSGAEHHNPMEMFATTVIRASDGHLTIYDKTQGSQNSRWYVSHVFGLSRDKVTVRNPYVGGAFGSGLRPQHNLPLAVMASLKHACSVKVVMTRPQMFTFGHRAENLQRVRLAANPDGALQAILHEATSETSRIEDHVEVVVNWSGMLYACEHIKLQYKLVPLDRHSPMDMRGPGAAHGLHALEVAMDELSYQLNMDPLALRLKNYAEVDPSSGKPYSSKTLRRCYELGAERFGWDKRPLAPRSMREGREWVGWGMATGMWDALQFFARASARLGADGRLVVSSAASDIGTGTYTAMAMIAASTMGMPLEHVQFQLGDSTLPVAPVEGGSSHVATVGSAVESACNKLKKRLFALARKLPDGPLGKVRLADVDWAGGQLRVAAQPHKAVALADIVRLAGLDNVEEKFMMLPAALKQRKFVRATHSAVFCEVRVDDDFGTVRVTRVVSAVDAGRIINPMAARSQIIGGVVWGISQALHEETLTDHRLGKIMNDNLADYHVSVNADIHDIDVIFAESNDQVASQLGAKGVGEIGQIGVAAAVANAIYHAVGRRVRSTPMTPDKVMRE
jgi:xanthine dehydrogenase YagR molybdenum-binding subunit